ncbi:MAG TPA: lysylphosphatidylglycerol synthase transmembrane domain-containing protein [Chloroflexota bacterium]|nr:lysylphosphatidylglycerol synthase transmembrane domain-containing protein [Chloroflexota bacterium]
MATRAGVARLVVSFGISAVLLALLIRSVDPASLGTALSEADWRLIGPAIALYFAAAWLRSIRWGLLLPEYHVPTPTLFAALVIGFTVNNLLPIRMGEIARAYLLARWRRVPYGASLASLVVERVLDGLSLAVLLLVGLRFVDNRPDYLVIASVLLATAFLCGAAVLALAAWRPSVIVWMAELLARPLPQRPRELALKLASNFARSLSLVRGRSRLLRLAGLSLLAWCVELSLFLVLMPGFGIPASPALALLVGSAANFATLVPSSPGYVGTFDGALITVVRDTAGIAAAPATAYAIVVHATLFLPVVLLGTLMLWRSHMTFEQITHAPDSASPTTSEGNLQAAA